MERSISRRLMLGGLGAALASGCTQQITVPVGRRAPTDFRPERPQYLKDLAALGVEWMPPDYGKAILVNIPSFELVAFQDMEPVITSRIIVGAPVSPTPVGTVHSGVVRFRPTWRPTQEMIRRHGYEDKLHPPGRRNPLGLATIRFDDGSLVYLHGTNSPRSFNRQNRAISNGCIRVEELNDLVAWTLEWPMEEVLAAMNGRRTYDVETSNFPIHLGYYTTFKLPGQEVAEYRNVYRRSIA